jgi:hypothetical protein
MIITNIKDSVVKKLKTLYPSYEVYDEIMKQGLNEPCFFVKIIEPNTNKEIGNRYKMNMMFDIHYFLDENTVDMNEQYHAMAEILYENFELFPHITSGYLRGLNKRHDIQDNVLHFFVDVSVNASVVVSSVLMGQLEENNTILKD